jgi:alkylhydroperoxidase family enzyme
VQGALDDFRTSALSEPEKGLFAFLEKLNHSPAAVGAADVEALKRLDWSDEAIYDAVTVCALFHFYNRWIDGTGVEDMPASSYAISGERLASQGYAVFGEQRAPDR